MFNFLRRWFSFNEDKKFSRTMVIAINVMLLAPLIWYVRLQYANIHYTIPQIISSVLLGYMLLGFQIYGFIIVIKLIMSFRKKVYLSEENLELIRRLGAILFLYVFAYYFSSWINLYVNKEHLPDDYAVIFFTNDNVLYLCAGAIIYLVARYKQKNYIQL